MAFGGAWRLWVRRCISPPVITSMPASSWSSTAAAVARCCASAIDAIESWPADISRSSGSYQSGTLCAPITVVAYLGYPGAIPPYTFNSISVVRSSVRPNHAWIPAVRLAI